MRGYSVESTAPIRICDNGGWTDTWVARHGKVFNIAVRPHVSVRIDALPAGSCEAALVLALENYGTRYEPTLEGAAWGPHPLLEACLRETQTPADIDIEVTIRSDAPVGGSTGTSAATVVAMLGAFDRLTGQQRTAHEIAYAAHAIETARLGRQSGVQDQLCSAYGGINFIEISEYPHARVWPLDVSESVRRELQRRLSLIYLGRPHSSSAVHEQVVRDLERRGPDCRELEALRRAAVRARDALLAGDFVTLGAAMSDNTRAQSELNGDLVPADAHRVIEIAAAHGAAGWKINGAGGDGGSITLLGSSEQPAQQAMIRTLIEENPAHAEVPIALSRSGLSVRDASERTILR